MHQNILSSLTRLWSKKMRELLNNKTDFLFPEKKFFSEKEAAVPMLMKISIMKVLLMFNEILQF